MLANKIKVADVLKIDSCSYLAKCREENIMCSSKQTHMFDYFICYHLESGWHVIRPNQGLSLGKGKSVGTRLSEAGFYKVFHQNLGGIHIENLLHIKSGQT